MSSKLDIKVEQFRVTISHIDHYEKLKEKYGKYDVRRIFQNFSIVENRQSQCNWPGGELLGQSEASMLFTTSRV